jgi:hypothetical protein
MNSVRKELALSAAQRADACEALAILEGTGLTLAEVARRVASGRRVPRQMKAGGDGGCASAAEWILPPDTPAWATHLSQQLAQIWATVKAAGQPVGGVRPVLTLSEALGFTGCKSVSALYRWLANWAPHASCGHGRYTRSALSHGLEKEALQSRRRRSQRIESKAAVDALTVAKSKTP